MSASDSPTTILRLKEAFCEAGAGPDGQHRAKPAAPFSMRLTAEERAFLDEHCGGRPWATYIRECVFGDKAGKRRVVRRPRIEDQELAGALSGLGRSRLSSNLNQLARSANVGTLNVSEDVEQQLQDACAAILAMREALIAALGLKPERGE